MRKVAVAGATGSIGRQTLEILRAQKSEFSVSALSAHSNVDELVEAAREFHPELVVVGNEKLIANVKNELPEVEVMAGSDGLDALSKSGDIVMNAVVGFAGLRVTLASLQAGKRVALANKESLVAGSDIVRKTLLTLGAELIPVDSEHSAIFQCLKAGRREEVAELVLTSSGGPFRTHSKEQLQHVSVADALAHPKWKMGEKITVDSSTMMNKALEIIEAHALFEIDYDQIRVVIHPQVILHSAVTFTDGSTIAQMSQPDMRLPISYALFYPQRSVEAHSPVAWNELGALEFEPVDLERFPAVQLGFDAGRAGGSAPAVLNAANEIAVAAFLDGRIGWGEITRVCEETLEIVTPSKPENVAELELVDQESRACAEEAIRRSS